jgi:hypothetical protein
MPGALSRSLRLGTRRLYHLGPFLGFLGDKLAEFGGRAAKHVAPMPATRAFIAGSASAALIAVLSFSMISAGVVPGATTANSAPPLCPADRNAGNPWPRLQSKQVPSRRSQKLAAAYDPKRMQNIEKRRGRRWEQLHLLRLLHHR